MSGRIGPSSSNVFEQAYYTGPDVRQAYKYDQVQQQAPGTQPAQPPGAGADGAPDAVGKNGGRIQPDTPDRRAAGGDANGGPVAAGALAKVVSVQPRDTLYAIALRNRVSLDALLKANPQFDKALLGKQGGRWFDPKGPRDKNRDPDLIRPGDKITIPASTQQLEGQGAKTTDQLRSEAPKQRPKQVEGGSDPSEGFSQAATSIADAEELNETPPDRPPATPGGVEAAQGKGLPRADSSQPTEVVAQGKAFISTIEKLPEFVRKHDRTIDASNAVLRELALYNRYILGLRPAREPADPNLRAKLLADVRAQSNRISFETLDRLAKVKDLAGIRDELKRIHAEVDGMVKGKSDISRLSEYCLGVEINILIARSKQLTGPQRTVDEVTALLNDLASGVGKQFQQRARHVYER